MQQDQTHGYKSSFDAEGNSYSADTTKGNSENREQKFNPDGLNPINMRANANSPFSLLKGIASQSTIEAKAEELAALVRSGDLKNLQKFLWSYKDDATNLMAIMERLALRNNSKELIFSVRKFTYRWNEKYCWAAICEFNLVRTRRILIVPSDPLLDTLVIEHQPSTVGKISCESPYLLMKQIGNIFSIPKFVPPPLNSQVKL